MLNWIGAFISSLRQRHFEFLLIYVMQRFYFMGLTKSRKTFLLDFVCVVSLYIFASQSGTHLLWHWLSSHSVLSTYLIFTLTHPLVIKRRQHLPSFLVIDVCWGLRYLSGHFSESKENPWELRAHTSDRQWFHHEEWEGKWTEQRVTATRSQSCDFCSEVRGTLGASELVRCQGCGRAFPLCRWIQFFQSWKVAVIEGWREGVNEGRGPNGISCLVLVNREMYRSQTCITSSSCWCFFYSWPQE